MRSVPAFFYQDRQQASQDDCIKMGIEGKPRISSEPSQHQNRPVDRLKKKYANQHLDTVRPFQHDQKQWPQQVELFFYAKRRGPR